MIEGMKMFRTLLIAGVAGLSLASPVLTTSAQALPTFDRIYFGHGDCYQQIASFTRGGVTYRYVWGYVCI
jgi:hypothetical protein